jgi:hypothetical protein
MWVFVDPLDQQVQLVLQAQFLGPSDQLALLEILDQQAPLAHKVFKVHRVHKVFKV